MSNENETPESLPEEGEELDGQPVSEDVKTPESAPQDKSEKTVPYERFQEVNNKLTELKKQLEESEPKKAPATKVVKTLDVDELVSINASLEGLDTREQEYLVRQYKMTGQPMKEIRDSEDFTLWQSAYRTKVEKDKSLSPSSTQPDANQPVSLKDKLTNATIAEKEKILEEMGLWQNPRKRADKRNIGQVMGY